MTKVSELQGEGPDPDALNIFSATYVSDSFFLQLIIAEYVILCNSNSKPFRDRAPSNHLVALARGQQRSEGPWKRGRLKITLRATYRRDLKYIHKIFQP